MLFSSNLSKTSHQPYLGDNKNFFSKKHSITSFWFLSPGSKNQKELQTKLTFSTHNRLSTISFLHNDGVKITHTSNTIKGHRHIICTGLLISCCPTIWRQLELTFKGPLSTQLFLSKCKKWTSLLFPKKQ